MSAKSETKKLARFFQEELPEEIEKGTPVDNAIRIIKRELNMINATQIATDSISGFKGG